MKLFSVNYTTPAVWRYSPRHKKWRVWKSWGPGVIPQEVGQRRSFAESRPFPGNSRWCSAWLNSREASGVNPKRGAVCSREDSRRYDVLSYTSGAAGGGGVIDILCPYQVSSTFCLYQVKSTFCLYQGVVYPLLTPTSVGRRAFRRPIYAR